MKKLLVLITAAFCFSAVNAQKERFIEVVAEEKMEVAPDEYTFTFRLRERTKYITEAEATKPTTVYKREEVVADPDVPEIVEDIEEVEAEVEIPPTTPRSRRNTYTPPKKRITITIQEQEQAIRAYLKKKGISEKNLNSFSDNYYSNSSRKEFMLVIDKPKELKEILYSLDTMGASRVRMQGYKTSSANKYKEEMAVKALKNAKKQAEKLVGVYGEKLGDVISISETFGSESTELDKLYDLIKMELMRKNRDNNPNSILTYKVKVKFAIK